MGMVPGTDTTNKPKWWVGLEHYEFPNLTDGERRDVKSRFNIY